VTNGEIRAWYLSEVSKIAALDEQWTSRGDTLEQRARQAWARRHELRLKAREMMENPQDVELLRERDRKVYANPDGPTFEDLLYRLRSRNVTGDRAFRRILAGALNTNEEITEMLRRGRRPLP
jgi:hypothetical protein